MRTGAGREDLFTCFPHRCKTSARRVLSAPQRRSVSGRQPRSVSRRLRVCNSQIPLRGPPVCSPASPASGHRAPAPDTLHHGTSRPRPLGRAVDFDPGCVTDLGRQTVRPQGGRKGGVPPRAPPSHAQPRTSPPCAPSRGSALLPGKGKRSRLRHRLLKGQNRPSLLILPDMAPPSPQNTCREPPKAWISPPRPLLLRRRVAF